MLLANTAGKIADAVFALTAAELDWRLAWLGAVRTWAFRPRRNTACSSSVRRGRIRSAFSAWDSARTSRTAA